MWMTCIDVVLLLLLYAPGPGGTRPFPKADGMLRPGSWPLSAWGRVLRADSLWPQWTGLLLTTTLLTTGCTPLMLPPGQGTSLRYTPHGATGPALEEQPSDERPRALASADLGRPSARLTRQALLVAVDEVSGSTGDIASSLTKLAARQAGLGRANGVFDRYVVYGSNQLPWIHGALRGATTLADAASEVSDPDMELGILRITGPRLQAAMSGATLLAA